MDKVEVSGLRFHAFHGCHPEERKTGGTFVVDLLVEGDFSMAATSDRIEDAVDYVSLMAIVEEQMADRRDLIEHVAHSIAVHVLAAFSLVDLVSVTVKKLQPPVSFTVDFVAAHTSLKRGQN